MKKKEARLRKRETLPVVDMHGKVLGSCTISKFTRQAGKAYNEIILYDTDRRSVARIRGYRLHSRVRCRRLKTAPSGGKQEGNSLRIDSKDAVAVAQVALEYAGDAEPMLAAIQQAAQMLADKRRVKRSRNSFRP